MPIPPEAQTIELAGLDIWPGMVDAGSTIGLSEIGSLTETQDFADASRFEPELRTSTALHADSEHIPVTRANGILSAYVQPTGGLISGQGCVIDLRGWVPRELVLADPAALNVTIPTFVPRTPEGRRRGPGPGPGPGGAEGSPDPQARRKEQIEAIKEHFRRAMRYGDIVAQARGQGRCSSPLRSSLECALSLREGAEAGDLPRQSSNRDPRRASDRQGTEAEGGHRGGQRGLEGRRGDQGSRGSRAGGRHLDRAGPRARSL